MPVSLILLFLLSAAIETRYAAEYRSLGHILDKFGLLLVYGLIVTAFLYMAARVFGVTQRPPLTSQVQTWPPMVPAVTALI